jgi:uncharacterized protein
MIPKPLIEAIRRQYALPWNGVHGIGHWARVYENGLRIAACLPGVNPKVVALFAVFHDSRRVNEGHDEGHGRRGAELAKKLRGALFELSDEEFALLHLACCDHTDGHTKGNITVQACWDADRLDLNRVDITPDPRHLCTAPAKAPGMLAWANERGRRRTIPQFAIEGDWLILQGSATD